MHCADVYPRCGEPADRALGHHPARGRLPTLDPPPLQLVQVAARVTAAARRDQDPDNNSLPSAETLLLCLCGCYNALRVNARKWRHMAATGETTEPPATKQFPHHSSQQGGVILTSVMLANILVNKHCFIRLALSYCMVHQLYYTMAS